MPSNVGRRCPSSSRDASLNLKSVKQDVPAGAMAEQSTSLAAHSTGRMLLGAFLVLTYCLTTCFGVPQRPAVFPRTLDSPGSLKWIAQVSNNAEVYQKFAPSDTLHLGEDTVPASRFDDQVHKVGHRGNNRKPSLRKLMENLKYLQNRNAEDSSESQTLRNVDGGPITSEIAGKLGVDTIAQQPHYHLQPGLPLKHKQSETQLLLKPVQVVAQLDMVLLSPDEHGQSIYVDRKSRMHKQINTNHLLSVHDGPVINERSTFNDVYKYLNLGVGESAKHDEQGIEATDFEVGPPSVNSASVDLDEDTHFVDDITEPSNFGSSDYNEDTFNQNDIQDGDNQDDSENTSNENNNFMDIPLASVAIATGTDSMVRDTHSSDSTSEGSDQLSNIITINSLIHKTVKKMEGIIRKRVAHYSGIYDADSMSQRHDGISQTNEQKATHDDSESRKVSTPLTHPGAASSGAVTENEYPTDSDELSPQPYHHHVNDVMSAVSNAVASRTVPRDAQFWRNVSSYLDSSDYLSRTRRSPNRSRKRAQYVHLSITYGHVMPCQYKDRFYCMNGGTCVFVGALDIKTCRCPIGYTGVRCEMIDQEYILSLLTNTLIFS